MKQSLIFTAIAALSLLCSCAPQDDPNVSLATEYTAAKITVADTNIEAEYFAGHEQIDNAVLFIPESKDFCIQLPADARISKRNDNYDAVIQDAGTITMTVSDGEYTPMTADELTKAYNSMRGDATPIAVADLTTITENGVETGRSYTIDYGSGPKDHITEKLQNDGSLMTVRTSMNGLTEYTTEKEAELFEYYSSLKLL